MVYEHKIKDGIIHIHTEYSIKDSAMSIEQMLLTANELGAPAVVLTDHGVLSGTYPLILTAKELKEKERINKDMKVVPGVEAYVQGDGVTTRNMHLILIPCDYQGYKAISKAVSAANLNIEVGKTMDTPRMSMAILEEFFGAGSIGHGHVIATSACAGGVLGQILSQNIKINKDIASLKKKMASPNNPNNPENKKAMERLKELEDIVASLTERKKALQAIAKKSLSRLEKSVASLEGKEGYESAVTSLNDALKEKEDAARELETIANRLTAISKEKKPLLNLRTKLKNADTSFSLLESKIAELSKKIKNDGELIEEAKQAALKYREVFGEGNFYIELQFHGFDGELEVMSRLANIANELKFPVVATNDAHYAKNTPEDVMARRLNMSQRFKKFVETKPGEDQLYIKADDELYEAICHVMSKETADRAMAGIGQIIAKCDVVFPKETHFPKFTKLPEGVTSQEYLKQLAEDAIYKKFTKTGWTREHQKRLEYELKIIHEMGFDDYHLVVQDFLNYTRELAIDKDSGVGVGVGPGRGSAVGSLVCYLIGITSVDPIKHNLLFERYLNPERVSLPDIDSDFANYIRPAALEYVRKTYGENGVCMIETDSRQLPVASLKAIGRILNDGTQTGLIYYNAAERIKDAISTKENKSFSTMTDEGVTLKEKLLSKFTDKVSVDIINKAALIEGSMINYGCHAAGVVIADNGDLTEYVPLRMNEGAWVCQCTKKQVEKNAGLLKFDFLGLKNLDVINKCVQMIYKNHKVKIDVNQLPFEKAVFKNVFASGETNGVFQFESAGMKKMLIEFKPDCIEDIILLVAAYRPGPMQYIPAIRAVKSGEAKAKYIFSELAEVLGDTYGKPVYQEQIQAIVHQFADCTLGEADIVRRIMSSKDTDALEDPKTGFKTRFIEGMKKHGAKTEEAEKFWEELKEFAKYAFNKSHATAYAYVAYQTAWLKYNYPAEYIASCLSYTSSIDRYPMFIHEAHKAGVAVIPPSYATSAEDFIAVNNTIYFGINNIKGIGALGEVIVEARNQSPFTSFKDFLRRVPLSRDHLTALIEAGTFDEFNPNRKALIEGSEAMLDVLKMISDKEKKLKKNSEVEEKTSKVENAILRLTDEIEALKNRFDTMEFMDAVETPATRLEKERELLGYYVSGHPMDTWSKPKNAISLDEISEGNNLCIAGIIRNLRELHTKKDGALFYSFTLEDEAGSIPVMCWHKQCVPENTKYIVEGLAVSIFGRCEVKEETDEGEKKYQFSLKEIGELKQKVSFEELVNSKVDNYFDKRYTVTVSNVVEWIAIKDRFKEFRDDENGAILAVRIKGYRKSTLSYKVSKNILEAGLGVISV